MKIKKKIKVNGDHKSMNKTRGWPNKRSSASSRTASRQARKEALAEIEKRAFRMNVRAAARQARRAALNGALIDAGLEAYESNRQYRKGKITGKQYAGRIIKKGAKGAAHSAIRTAGVCVIQSGGKALAKKTGSKLLTRAFKGTTGVNLAVGAVEQIVNTGKLCMGKINRKEYASRTAENAGSTGGAIAGAAYGMAVAGPVGAVVGSIVVSCGGGYLAKRVWGWLAA